MFTVGSSVTETQKHEENNTFPSVDALVAEKSSVG